VAFISPDSRYEDTSFVSGYEVGDVISIVNNNKYENCATITAKNGNVLTLDVFPFTSDNTSWTGTDPDDFSIYCVNKYNVGGIDFGGGSLAEGVNTLAINIGAHAEGAQTKAYG
jgi:hypothetical protein